MMILKIKRGSNKISTWNALKNPYTFIKENRCKRPLCSNNSFLCPPSFEVFCAMSIGYFNQTHAAETNRLVQVARTGGPAFDLALSLSRISYLVCWPRQSGVEWLLLGPNDASTCSAPAQEEDALLPKDAASPAVEICTTLCCTVFPKKGDEGTGGHCGWRVQ